MNSLRPRYAGIVLGVTSLLVACATASAQTSDAPAQTSDAQNATGAGSVSTVPTPDPGQPPKQHSPLLLDIEAYYTSPLHWDARDWAYFGGALGLVAAARHYDTSVRTHFISQGTRAIGGSTDDLQDALPAVGAVVGTWLYANLLDSTDGHREANEMVEAGGLSVVTAYALKYVAARERPDQTDDPNKWRSGGSSFPSTHAAGAFAIGAILAESGNDDYRLIRRFLGYGAVAGFTFYERLKHNAHWLSDDVAGAEIGGATAHFVMERAAERREARQNYSLSVVPLEGGAMLTYSLNIE